TMLILGISGGMHARDERPLRLPAGAWTHDAAAVLLRDGEVVAGIEEERLSRIKHTHCAPLGAIRFCLESQGVSLNDLHSVAFYATREFVEQMAAECLLLDPAL